MSTHWKRILVIGLMLVAITAVMVQGAAAQYPGEQILVSAKTAGMTDDGVEYDPFDILVREYDGTDYWWWKLFDGEDHGLGEKHKIDAFSIMGDIYDYPTIYMSFVQDAIKVPGIVPKVQGEDVVEFDWYWEEYSLFFDGSDVGLTTRAEKIDGLDVWEPYIDDATFPYDCNAGVLFISTQGAYRVPAANGGSLVGDGNDVLMFCATNLGSNTAGFWFRGFDVTFPGETPFPEEYPWPEWPWVARNAMYGLDINSVYWDSWQENNEAAWLEFSFIVKKPFNVPFAAGGPSETFWWDPWFGEVYGPDDDFNQTWPALNGTSTGYDRYW